MSIGLEVAHDGLWLHVAVEGEEGPPVVFVTSTLRWAWAKPGDGRLRNGCRDRNRRPGPVFTARLGEFLDRHPPAAGR